MTASRRLLSVLVSLLLLCPPLSVAEAASAPADHNPCAATGLTLFSRALKLALDRLDTNRRNWAPYIHQEPCDDASTFYPGPQPPPDPFIDVVDPRWLDRSVPPPHGGTFHNYLHPLGFERARPPVSSQSSGVAAMTTMGLSGPPEIWLSWPRCGQVAVPGTPRCSDNAPTQADEPILRRAAAIAYLEAIHAMPVDDTCDRAVRTLEFVDAAQQALARPRPGAPEQTLITAAFDELTALSSAEKTGAWQQKLSDDKAGLRAALPGPSSCQNLPRSRNMFALFSSIDPMFLYADTTLKEALDKLQGGKAQVTNADMTRLLSAAACLAIVLQEPPRCVRDSYGLWFAKTPYTVALRSAQVLGLTGQADAQGPTPRPRQ